MSCLLRAPLARALAALALVGCGGATAATPTPRMEPAEAAHPATERSAGFLVRPAAGWTSDPAYADVDLPFVMGITDRPCDAEYAVQGYPRIDVRYTYDARRIHLAVTPGEMYAEGHVFCLPNPPFLAALGLEPLVLTWELDEQGRVVGRALEVEGGASSRVRYVWDGDRWTGIAFDDDDVRPVDWQGDLVASTPDASGGRRTFDFDGEARLVDRRTEAPDGALTIAQYVYEEHSPRLVERSVARYPDPDGDPASEQRAVFELDDDGRPTRCTVEDLTVRYAYDERGRLLERRAFVVDEHEEEAWAWTYRYDCSAPRPD